MKEPDHNCPQKEIDEYHALKCFINNDGERFDNNLCSKGAEEPVDLEYGGTKYQITYGDQTKEGQFRKMMNRSNNGLMYRSTQLEDWPQLILQDALQKKSKMDGKGVTLLIKCTSTGPHSLSDDQKMLPEFLESNSSLRGTWDDIFVVFLNGNVRVTNT